MPHNTIDNLIIRLKAANYAATAGQTIAGNLARGVNGQFTSAGNASSSSAGAEDTQSLRDRVSALINPQKSPKDAAAKRSAQRNQKIVENAAKFLPSTIRDAFTKAFTGGGLDSLDEGERKQLYQAGLAAPNKDGDWKLTGTASAIRSALASGSPEKLQSALSKAAKIYAQRRQRLATARQKLEARQQKVDTDRQKLDREKSIRIRIKAVATDPTPKQRESMPGGDFVFPDEKAFPVTSREGVMRAVHSWGRYKGPQSFETFKRNLTALAKRKGWASALPADWQTTTATKEGHTGVMLAFFPDAASAYRLVLNTPDAEGYDELHLTLCYLGDMLEMECAKDELVVAVTRYASTQLPLEGEISGIGRFTSVDEGNATTALYASFDSPALPAFRQGLVEALEKAGICYAANHGYTPHITLAYLPEEEPTPDIRPPALKLRFNAISLCWGGERIDIPLGPVQATKDVAVASAGYLGGPGGLMSVPALSSATIPNAQIMPNQARRAKKPTKSKLLNSKATWKEASFAGDSLTVFKQADGNYRWVGMSSSGFRDRDGEIVPSNELEADVARVDMTKEYGPLLWWHEPSLKLGECDFNAMCGRVLIESGTFASKEVAEGLTPHLDKLGMSIGFGYQSKPDLVYKGIRRKERSFLPAEVASNLLTRVFIPTNGDLEMPITNEKKRGFLEALIGPKAVKTIEDTADNAQKQAEEAGLAFKAKADAAAATEMKADGAMADTDTEPDALDPNEMLEGEPEGEGAETEGEGEEGEYEGSPSDNTVDMAAQELFTLLGQKIEAAALAALAPLKEMLTATKEQREAFPQLVEAFKEVALLQVAAIDKNTEALKAVQSLSEAQAKQIGELQAKVAELTGELPKAVKARASQSAATVVEKTEVKQLHAQKADPDMEAIAQLSQVLLNNPGGLLG